MVLSLLFASTCGDHPTSPSQGGVSIDGVYDLNLETACAAVPADQRSRRYVATVTGSPKATVTLSNGTFWQHPTDGLQNHFTISKTGAWLVLSVPGQFGVTEQIGPKSFFSFRGAGKGHIHDSSADGVELTGTLVGPVGFGEDLLDPARHQDCSSDSPVSMRFSRRSAPAPPPQVAHSIASVQIDGPSSVAPGGSAQFRAMARMTDGTTREVTDGVSWRSSNAATKVDTGGTVTGQFRSEANLIVTVNRPNLTPATATREVIVVPDGTFRVIGRITDAVTPSVPIAGARVEVVAGAAGLAATTDDGGQYRLYGVPPDASIAVTKFGFETQIVRLPSAAHQTLNFQIRFSSAPPNMAGTYRLTIAAETCPGSSLLPTELRERNYTATILQTGPSLTVVLSGATFQRNGPVDRNTFFGTIDSSGAVFTLANKYAYTFYGPQIPDIVEVLPDSSFLIVEGRTVTLLTATGVTGTFNGSLSRYSPSDSWFLNASLGTCTSSTMRFTLAR
jgi:hypothetical protein